MLLSYPRGAFPIFKICLNKRTAANFHAAASLEILKDIK